jgi:hypothetical protein
MEEKNIKGVLPPSFTAWSQLLRRVERANIEHGKNDKLKTVIWTEVHPTAGLKQSYEFTMDEIKARAFEELIADYKKFKEVDLVDAGYNDHYVAHLSRQFFERLDRRYLPQ